MKMVLANLATGKYLFFTECRLQFQQDPRLPLCSHTSTSWVSQGTSDKLLCASAFSSVFKCFLGTSSGVDMGLYPKDGQGNWTKNSGTGFCCFSS